MDPPSSQVTLRCPPCGTLNRLALGKNERGPRCGRCREPFRLDRPLKIAEADFRRTVLEAAVPVLVDVYADWCGPCKWLDPLVETIAREEAGRLLVTKLDSDESPELHRSLKIGGVPTVILFRQGRELGRSVGVMPEELQELVQRALA